GCYQDIGDNTVIDTPVAAISRDEDKLDVLEYIEVVSGHVFHRLSGL
ncbi:unnamed protein product, partial [marine sediment metagenome]